MRSIINTIGVLFGGIYLGMSVINMLSPQPEPTFLTVVHADLNNILLAAKKQDMATAYICYLQFRHMIGFLPTIYYFINNLKYVYNFSEFDAYLILMYTLEHEIDIMLPCLFQINSVDPQIRVWVHGDQHDFFFDESLSIDRDFDCQAICSPEEAEIMRSQEFVSTILSGLRNQGQ